MNGEADQKTTDDKDLSRNNERPLIVFRSEVILPEGYEEAATICTKVRQRSYDDLNKSINDGNLEDLIFAGDELRDTVEPMLVLNMLRMHKKSEESLIETGRLKPEEAENPSPDLYQNYLRDIYKPLAEADAKHIRVMNSVIGEMEDRPGFLKVTIVQDSRDLPSGESFPGNSKLLVEFPKGTTVKDPFGIDEDLTENGPVLIYTDPVGNACTEGQISKLRSKFILEKGVKVLDSQDTVIHHGYIPYSGIKENWIDLNPGSNPGDKPGQLEAYDEATGESREAGVWVAAAACGNFSADSIRRIRIPKELAS